MLEDGFSVNAVNDTLISAKQALERADFAELIRKNATGEIAELARKSLEGLSYERFTYDEVLKHAEKIMERKRQAYEIFDNIRALEIKIKDYEEQVNATEARRILEEARKSFELERYKETYDLLAKSHQELEAKKAELTILSIVAKSGKGFVERNWRTILLIILVLLFVGWVSWSKIKIKKMEKTLAKLKSEKKTLGRLMEKAQIDRFKKKKISKSMYDTRMKFYNKKMNEIKETIPVLEAELKKKHS